MGNFPTIIKKLMIKIPIVEINAEIISNFLPESLGGETKCPALLSIYPKIILSRI
jgi:hypothetical protein